MWSIASAFFAWLASLRRRLLPPQLAIMEIATALWPPLALRALVEAGVVDRLHDAPASADELAADLHLHAPSVYRVLRLLAGYDVMRERRDGRFELTRIGERAASRVPGNSAAFIRYVGEPWQLQPWADLATTLRTGEPAFDRRYGSSFFTYAREHPDVARLFDAAMSSVSQLHADAVARTYDFGGAGEAVDVGGGNGLLLATVLRKYSGLRGVLFDLPHATAGADAVLASVRDRVRVESGDFFERVPAGGDVYILSHILHDWNDDQALRILRNVRAAMGERSRVVVVECILPSRDNRWHQGKLTDVQMLAVLPGKERTREEFTALLAAANLRIARLIATPSAEYAIEALPV